jgi:hypothetical protein
VLEKYNFNGQPSLYIESNLLYKKLPIWLSPRVLIA